MKGCNYVLDIDIWTFYVDVNRKLNPWTILFVITIIETSNDLELIVDVIKM